MVKCLLSGRADINAKSDVGYTPLHLAVIKGHDKIVEYLISENADVNTADKERGGTPLHSAAANNIDVKIAQMLIKAGAKVNAKDFAGGGTPLDLAIPNNNVKFAKALVDAGADVNSPDNKGSTPLGIAKIAAMGNPAFEAMLRCLSGAGTLDFENARLELVRKKQDLQVHLNQLNQSKLSEQQESPLQQHSTIESTAVPLRQRQAIKSKTGNNARHRFIATVLLVLIVLAVAVKLITLVAASYYFDKGERDHILGREYSDANYYSKAVNYYNKAIKLRPVAKIFASRGQLYLDTYFYDSAISDYTEAIRLNPNDARYYNNREIGRAHV
jgi:ankyrin repeat protein